MQGIKAQIREIPYLRWILLVSNWLSQGIINADKTEKIYRISFTIITASFLFFLMGLVTDNLLISSIISFVVAHTFNWFFNGNIITILIHRLYYGKTSKTYLFDSWRTLILYIATITPVLIIPSSQ